MQQQQQQRRADFVPAPAPAKPAWGQALYARTDSTPKFPTEPSTGSAATAAAAAQMMHSHSESHRQDVTSQQEPWNSRGPIAPSSYWREDNGPASHCQRGPAEGGPRSRDGSSLHDDAGQARSRGRRARGEGGRSGASGGGGGRGRHAVGDLHHPHSSALSAANSSTPQPANIHSTASSVTASGTPPPAAPSVSASSNANSDADAAAVAAAAKAAKAMECIALPALPSPVFRKSPVDILPANSTNAPAATHAAAAARANPSQDVQSSKGPVGATLQREGSVVAPPQPQHSAPAVYESPYNASDLGLPSSNSVPALDSDEKHAGMFDGADMGALQRPPPAPPRLQWGPHQLCMCCFRIAPHCTALHAYCTDYLCGCEQSVCYVVLHSMLLRLRATTQLGATLACPLAAFVSLHVAEVRFFTVVRRPLSHSMKLTCTLLWLSLWG